MSENWPTEVRLSKDRKVLTVTFDGGDSFALPAEYLRVKSPSAEVQGHSAEERKTVPGKRDVGIIEVLPVGNYAVQFTSTSAPKGSHYTVVVVAGAKKTSASAVTAEKLAAGGVAMKIDVKANLSIQGQVSAEDKATRIGKNGQLMVWIPKKVGSNLAAHWAESDSAEAKEVMTSTSYSRQNLQNMVNQGASP